MIVEEELLHPELYWVLEQVGAGEGEGLHSSQVGRGTRGKLYL
jgi:hypothetical protein